MTAAQRILQGVGVSVALSLLTPFAPCGRTDPLRDAHAVLERVFQRGEAALLRPLLPRRLKIYLSCGSLGIPEGYYGADQMILLFDRLFGERLTTRFSALDPPQRGADEGQAVIVAHWQFRPREGPSQEVGLSFALALDGGWTIREIRDLK